VDRAGGELLGGCGLKPALDARYAGGMAYGPGEVELGYGLRRSSWGSGLATELARALVRKAFRALGAAWVVASVMVGNGASIRVLEKAGLRQVGGPYLLTGEDQPSLKYALGQEQFDLKV
jgi:RimJ/RimL family protein N-acetyltransferase